MNEKTKTSHAITGASEKLKKAINELNRTQDSASKAEEVERLAVDIITLCATYRAITQEEKKD